jgi:hypothetical protein
MDQIQFRIHPSVGMARMGESADWYFLGPEIPRYIQEQYPNLRQKPEAIRHPAGSAAAAAPVANRYRDQADKILPQAARFRVFAYFFTPGIAEPYRVIELKAQHADIEWTVTLANHKGVDGAGDIFPNTPAAVTLKTKSSDPHANFQSGTDPNLGWAVLEKDTSGIPTNRLHLIGNEGAAAAAAGGLPFQRQDGTAFLYQNNWQDTAADGPVEAIVELKPAFTTAFPGYAYLVPGVADAQSLPPDKKVTALKAWAVVNMPDYVPDMGHFVSVWDLALNQSWKRVVDGKVRRVTGRHNLVTAAKEAGSYAFYDYFTHLFPQLALFTDVAYVSGQARSASHDSGATNSYTKGVQHRTKLIAAATAAATTISISKNVALQLKAASQGAPFQITLSDDVDNPLAAVNSHEFVNCTNVADSGVPVLISYEYTTAGTGSTITITNAVMTTSTPFGMDLFNTTSSKIFTVRLNAVHIPKMSFGLKSEGWAEASLEYEAVADSAGIVGHVSMSD